MTSRRGNQLHAFDIARSEHQIRSTLARVLVRMRNHIDQQNLVRGFERLQRRRQRLGLVIAGSRSADDLQLAVAELRRESRAQSAERHLARQIIGIVARHGTVDRAAMTPQRRTDGTHAGAAGALLLPQLLARTRNFPADLGLGRAATRMPGAIVAHRLVDQLFVHFGAEDGVGQIDRADNLILRSKISTVGMTISSPSGPGHNRRSDPGPRP